MAPVSAVLARLGRVPAGISAPVTGPAAGNWRVTSDARGAAAAQPGKGMGDGPANASPYPQRDVITPAYQLGLRARTAAYQNGRLIARDRHIAEYRGRTDSSANRQATGGSPNPEADGPPRPSWRMLNRTVSFQSGTDSTANLDNTAFHATVPVMGESRLFPLGTQDGSRSKIPGGTPGLADYRPYGSRKPLSGGPQPRVVAQPGGPYPLGTVLQQGSPQDGPQTVWGGEPHGLVSSVQPGTQVSAVTIRDRFGQVRPPRVNRPLNSRIAGQSFDQAVVHLNGRQAVRLPRMAGGRPPGVNGRFLR